METGHRRFRAGDRVKVKEGARWCTFYRYPVGLQGTVSFAESEPTMTTAAYRIRVIFEELPTQALSALIPEFEFEPVGVLAD